MMIATENFEFPECWKDDTRMNVLFAPFRSKSINPTDWDSKMKFWKVIIEDWCRHHKQVLITTADLNNNLQRNGKIPSCIETVVEDLTRNGTIITHDAYNQLTEPSWSSWAVQKLVTNPIKWSFNKVKNSIMTQTENSRYVHLPVVKCLGEALVRNLPEELRGKLISVNQVMELSGMGSMEQLMMILQWLQSQHLVAVTTISPVQVVKFPKTGVRSVKITEVDRGIYQLEAHETSLKKNIEKLEQEKEAALNEAKKYVAAKMRPMAKSSLRKKKELEKYIEKRAIALENIQSLLQRLYQAESDAAVLQSYRLGVDALKLTLKETGLSEDSVTNTMDELQDALDVHDEIEASLSRSLDTSADNELEEELSELLESVVPDLPPDDPFSGQSHPNLPDVPSADTAASSDNSDLTCLEMRLKALTS